MKYYAYFMTGENKECRADIISLIKQFMISTLSTFSINSSDKISDLCVVCIGIFFTWINGNSIDMEMRRKMFEQHRWNAPSDHDDSPAFYLWSHVEKRTPICRHSQKFIVYCFFLCFCRDSDKTHVSVYNNKNNNDNNLLIIRIEYFYFFCVSSFIPCFIWLFHK